MWCVKWWREQWLRWRWRQWRLLWRRQLRRCVWHRLSHARLPAISVLAEAPRDGVDALPLLGQAKPVERLAGHVLVPHSAVLAEPLVTLLVGGNKPIALLRTKRRRYVSARHALEPLALLPILSLHSLSLCTLPRPIDRTTVT